ncbi:similar to Saccharomyces cerevisiae YJL061W NUP82 Nucleoporin, subunit of the nuclear pore complex (NPC) [Maudiozyma barnettii]|uniref:Similar to Saccharomyces cerevisiae YJL061W NUP82 Nucleoporin, subunit of the nuclear pore complex (NPC) n=1 Tax=Maudiozyma barnettii TaxID=61262 RepID=A0A8H2VK26_9SACH|nr:linker nucleoporin NUP82 [Kazachstania barnettii]CAB4256857.1 similar to Saccharomyces cerevisiae YJL061W NUP82 Nucleoporin, subunit of the nuclear pore complex (NPC) [Kazachstania barnettii]CAD1785276.1 similar to Saccharomyces cerevisiae YJL061W NUP82 Nucleoporin, subunit of the nuclear pore complex (NPC) [Kazachstania barnettii]
MAHFQHQLLPNGALLYRDEALTDLEKKPIFNNNIVPPVNPLTATCELFLSSSKDSSQLVTLSENCLRWGNYQKEKFNTMPIEPLNNFGDQHFSISTSKNMICIFFKNTLKTVEVPWGYEDIEKHMAFGFQSEVFTFDNFSNIRQILFHPRAIDDNSLVILFEDDTVVLFDLDTKNQVVLNKCEGSFGFNGRINDIKSMTFSKDGLTLYLLSVTDGGDIYALYPCLPAKIIMDAAELKRTRDKAVLLYDSLDEDTKDDVKSNVIRQYKFISRMYSDNSKTKRTEFEIDSNLRVVQPQGPFTISPYPTDLYETTANEIHRVDIENSTEVFALLFENGTILILYQDEEMSMCWDSENYVYSNSMVVVERIDHFVKLIGSNGELKIFKDFNERNRLLVTVKSRIGLDLINMSSWGRVLDKAVTDYDLSQVAGTTFSSDIKHMDGIRSDPSGCAVWRYKGKTGVIVAGPGCVRAELLKLPQIIEEPTQTREDSPVLPTETIKFKAGFSQPIQEIRDLTTAYIRRCSNPFSEVISPEVRGKELSNAANEIQLEALTKLSSQLGNVIVQGESLGVMLHSRLLEQQFELTKQIKGTSDIIEKQDTLVDRYEEQIKILSTKMAKQDALIMRLVNLNQQVSKANVAALTNDNTISIQEVTWFKEIRNQIFKFNDFVHSQKALQEQLEFVKRELSKLQEKSKDTQSKTEREWGELRTILEGDAAVIKECNTELQKISSKIGA